MKNRFLKYLILLNLFTLFGCTKISGYEQGFDIQQGSSDVFEYAVRSDTIIFDIENVVLDFYFGFAQEKNTNFRLYNPKYNESNEKEFVSLTLYLYDVNSELLFSQEYPDYKNIKGYYFIKEYDWDYLENEERRAIFTPYFLGFGKVKFGYHEELKIPEDLFDYIKEKEGESRYYIGGGKIGFCIVEVYFNQKTGMYCFSNSAYSSRNNDCLIITYKEIGNGQIKIID